MNQNIKNEELFKNMAMTFSVEGVTKDIQDILHKKMNYNSRVLKELNGMINSLSLSKDKDFKKSILINSKLSNFISDAYEEYKILSGTTNILLSKLLKRKEFLDESFDLTPEEN